MNEDVNDLPEEEGKAQLLSLFKEFGLDRLTLDFKIVTVDGKEMIAADVVFHEKDEVFAPGMVAQEYVDYKSADRLQKLVWYFGELLI